MGKYASTRNFGYGKSLAYAGKQALYERFGNGHFSTVATHAARFGQFVEWLKGEGIRDATKIGQSTVDAYGKELAQKVAAGELSVAYAQNLLSSVNVTLSALRGDEAIRANPAQLVGERSHTRTTAPGGLGQAEVQAALSSLRGAGLDRAAAVAGLAREFGMREREATLGNLVRWANEAKEHGAINITEGTKGGRGNEVDRWVPVTPNGMEALNRALAASPAGSHNLLAGHETYKDFLRGELQAGRGHLKEAGIATYHSLRAAYACERYQQLTAHPAPVITNGVMTADPKTDLHAREILTQELGHGRVDVLAAYIGGRNRA